MSWKSKLNFLKMWHFWWKCRWDFFLLETVSYISRRNLRLGIIFMQFSKMAMISKFFTLARCQHCQNPTQVNLTMNPWTWTKKDVYVAQTGLAQNTTFLFNLLSLTKYFYYAKLLFKLHKIWKDFQDKHINPWMAVYWYFI